MIWTRLRAEAAHRLDQDESCLPCVTYPRPFSSLPGSGCVLQECSPPFRQGFFFKCEKTNSNTPCSSFAWRSTRYRCCAATVAFATVGWVWQAALFLKFRGGHLRLPGRFPHAAALFDPPSSLLFLVPFWFQMRDKNREVNVE